MIIQLYNKNNNHTSGHWKEGKSRQRNIIDNSVVLNNVEGPSMKTVFGEENIMMLTEATKTGVSNS